MKITWRFIITWVMGVTVAIVLSSWLRNEDIQWSLLVGLIGIGILVTLIISGVAKFFNKVKERSDE